MKNLKLAVFFLIMPLVALSIDKINLGSQIYQLKKILNESNDAYICHTTPMYDQALTLHWFLSYFVPTITINDQYKYNAEVVLEESKKLSDIITVMEELEKSHITCNMQTYQLIKMLINSNEAYIHATPMYKQNLTLQWYLQLLCFCRQIPVKHYYNAEILLTESKRLADIILAMVKFKESPFQRNN